MSKQIELICGCILSYKDIDFNDSYIKGIKKIAKKNHHIKMLMDSILKDTRVYSLCDYHLIIIKSYITNTLNEYYDNK